MYIFTREEWNWQTEKRQTANKTCDINSGAVTLVINWIWFCYAKIVFEQINCRLRQTRWQNWTKIPANLTGKRWTTRTNYETKLMPDQKQITDNNYDTTNRMIVQTRTLGRIQKPSPYVQSFPPSPRYSIFQDYKHFKSLMTMDPIFID